MEISELLKMISSIDQKKGKCRGDLRLKVLLKSTHEYARRSWIDGKSGNPQKLQIMLRNSVMNHSSNNDSEITESEESSVSAPQKQPQSMQRVGPVENSSVSSKLTNEIVENKSHYLGNVKSDKSHSRKKVTESMLKYTKNFTKMKQSNLLKRIKRLKKYGAGNKKKILKALEVHFRRNNENQDFGQQQLNKSMLKKIQRLLKRPDTEHRRTKCEKTRKSHKRKLSEVNQDDCEELLDLDGFFNKLKALKCSDDSSL